MTEREALAQIARWAGDMKLQGVKENPVASFAVICNIHATAVEALGYSRVEYTEFNEPEGDFDE